MQIKILSPLWGHEHLPLKDFLHQIEGSGYDGIDTWIPADKKEQIYLLNYIQKHEFLMVCHQYQAEGSTFRKFNSSFIKNLNHCAESKPVLINSHTGKDYFTLEQNLALVDAADEFSAKTGIPVVHETHRGRLGYSPQMIREIFKRRPGFRITADFSHWVCVTESMLDNFKEVVNEAIRRIDHIHARVGFEQCPQVPDPASPVWANAVARFLSWWEAIILASAASGRKLFTITTEFGPPPYMPLTPEGRPVADQFSVNLYMKNLLHAHFKDYRTTVVNESALV